MKKILLLIIMCIFTVPVYSINEQEPEFIQTENEQVLETVVPDESANRQNNEAIEESIPFFNQERPLAQTQIPYKQPVSKRSIAKKFLIAMFAVIASSFLIFMGLSLYNRLRDGFIMQQETPPEGNRPLDTPNDLSDAVKTFLDKTNWN